jgi:hypothetical protein
MTMMTLMTMKCGCFPKAVRAPLSSSIEFGLDRKHWERKPKVMPRQSLYVSPNISCCS